MSERILIIGASGQVGSELVIALRKIYGETNVIASDIHSVNPKLRDHSTVIHSTNISDKGPYIELNALDKNKIYDVVKKNKITQIYLLAAMLSAKSEENVELAWRLNTLSLSNVLQLAEKKLIKKLFWPSSIAVFGHTTHPKILTPQYTIMEPNTVYGISKLAGERWCEYYNTQHNVDVRRIRYPGLIGWATEAGGGTTDYAPEMLHFAAQKSPYTCFVREDTKLPFMVMTDAIDSIINIMSVDKEQLSKTVYNISSFSASVGEFKKIIQSYYREAIIKFDMDEKRQSMVDSWPEDVDDNSARNDWNFSPVFNFEKAFKDYLIPEIRKQYA